MCVDMCCGQLAFPVRHAAEAYSKLPCLPPPNVQPVDKHCSYWRLDPEIVCLKDLKAKKSNGLTSALIWLEKVLPPTQDLLTFLNSMTMPKKELKQTKSELL